MQAQPAHAGRWTAWVVSWRAIQRRKKVAVHAEALAGGGEVGADEQEPRGRAGPIKAMSYWPTTRWAR